MWGEKCSIWLHFFVSGTFSQRRKILQVLGASEGRGPGDSCSQHWKEDDQAVAYCRESSLSLPESSPVLLLTFCG